MSAVINVAFGIAIAFIVFFVSILGISVFHPEPKDPWAACNAMMPVQKSPETFVDPMTDANYKQCYDNAQAVSESYKSSIFIIGNVLACIIIIAAFFTMNMQSVAAGLLFAAIGLIIYAFAQGWTQTNDITKFIVAVVVAAIILFCAISYIKAQQAAPKKKQFF